MLAAEKQVLRDQAKSGANKGKPKPANIIDKIISGRINKVQLQLPVRHGSNCLLAPVKRSSILQDTAYTCKRRFPAVQLCQYHARNDTSSGAMLHKPLL